ncbi:MAG TPA: carbohydrate binding domain-containing protein, partial [Pyrinomonadaceae bacterium]
MNPTIGRVALTLLAIGLCLFLIQASARFGFTRLLTRYALISNSVSVADEAVLLSPSDPEAHRARATILNRLQMPGEAVKSLEIATTLRYRDDYLWIELGNTKEELGNTTGALAAMDQAVRWAPYYAHTHWQRGNLLLRMGQPADAFADLKKAASANQAYFPNLIDLAWSVTRGDVKATEDLIGITNDTERLALIRFLAGKGEGNEVLHQLRFVSRPLFPEDSKEIVRLLLSAKAFRQAAELWDGSGSSVLLNASFEDPLILNDTGFGWIVSPHETKNRLAVDVSEALDGAKSLQISLDGNWTPGTPLLSQTIIVEPETTYRLSFSVKTKDLVTGGAPVMIVSDATNGQLLGKSENFPTATSPWTSLNFVFTTLPTSQAAVIRLQRNNCDSSTCPIFGTLLLDQFHIEQTKATKK